MKLKEPNTPLVPTVRITAMDVESGKSKTITVYDTTPEKVIEEIEALAASPVVVKRRQQHA